MPVVKRILCIDVGGTGLKAAVISPRGKYLVKRVRVKTPKRRKPQLIVKALSELANGQPVSTPESKSYGCSVKYKK